MKAIAELSPDGFVTNGKAMMLKLYEYFMSSDYSQSNVFMGGIASLKYIISEASDAIVLDTMVTEALTTMYESYFTNVAVTTTVVDKDNKITITVNIVGTDAAGNICRLDKSVYSVNNKIVGFDKEQEKYYA